MIDQGLLLYLLTFLLSFLLTVGIMTVLLPSLKKKAAQPIYSEGPRWHLSKSGTPTMGGAAFVPAVLLSIAAAFPVLLLRGERDTVLSLTITLIFCLLNALIGMLDDFTKLKRKENAGLTPIQKLSLQFIISLLYLILRRMLLSTDLTLHFSFGELSIGFLYYPLGILLLLGIINCANLTDGVDGLAASVAFAIGVSVFYLSVYSNMEGALLSSALIGASVSFLIFNLHPAKIFMGDTGSLFFGAMAMSAVFTLGNPLLILPLGGVYILEGISVILQVILYKLTGKRLFLMAPYHHHLEKKGWSENKIAIGAILLTLLLSLFAVFLYRG